MAYLDYSGPRYAPRLVLMSPLLINAALFLIGLFGMEAVAYYMHKYVMHGLLWSLHRDHHEPHEGFFERNDLFGIFFSLPSIVLIYIGVNHHNPPVLWLGLGIAGYGLVYFIFHDVIVHRRVSIPYHASSTYMKRIIQAHWLHHAIRTKEGAVSFGFIYSPPIATLKAQLRAARKAQQTPAAD